MADFKQIGNSLDGYWVFQPKLLYKEHLLLCSIMIMETVIRLVMALVASPVLYRLKYLSVLLMFLIIVGADIVFYYAEDVRDASILFFASGSAILIYATFYFVPDMLRKKLLAKVLHEMEDSLMMFDDKGNCVYLNNKWSQNDVVTKMKKSEFETALNAAQDRQKVVCVNYGQENRYYENRFDDLRDEHGKYIGCYYIFRDITMERELLHKQNYLANHDVLTGLYNRNCFFQQSEAFIKRLPEENFLIVCQTSGSLR